MKVNLEKGYNGFMRYHDITKDDMLNGDGLRAVIIQSTARKLDELLQQEM